MAISVMLVVKYRGVGISVLFAIVTGTISGIKPILRQTFNWKKTCFIFFYKFYKEIH